MTQANVDPSEIEHFSALAKQWWETSGPMGPLHAINPLRLGFIERFEQLDGQKIVDVGCGGGILTEALAKSGAQASGIDLAHDSIQVATDHAAGNKLKIDYQVCAVEQFAQEHHGQFDSVTCMEMLEHVPDPAAIVSACAQLLKPGGSLYLSTINRNPKSFALAIVGAEHVLNLIPKGTHHYDKFIKPSELAAWCRASKLEVGSVQGMSYNPLTRTHKLTRDVDVNYLMRASKPA
ncbi:MAG: bifunctional 2-polyprenyl-6-hydroxyphenol methylase/3-demethylubiquinol 3-O-methyltransferase UbiG [Oceanococcus sp.]